MVHVQPINACIEISFALAPPSPAPYRIDNRTPYLFVARQKGAEHRAHVVQPMSQAPFAWTESSLEHVLLVSLSPPPKNNDLATIRGPAAFRSGVHVGWRADQAAGGRAGVSERQASERQTVRMDAMMRSVPLLVSGLGGGAREAAAAQQTYSSILEEPAEPSSSEAAAAAPNGSSASVWAHVGMQGGLRVLTLSAERLEPVSPRRQRTTPHLATHHLSPITDH